MAWVCVDKDGTECSFNMKPEKAAKKWLVGFAGDGVVELPKGSIKKLIGRTLTWADDSVELKEEEET